MHACEYESALDNIWQPVKREGIKPEAWPSFKLELEILVL